MELEVQNQGLNESLDVIASQLVHEGTFSTHESHSKSDIDGESRSGDGSDSHALVKKVSAPPSGTVVCGRILKRTELIPCRRDDKPSQLIEIMLKTSKRSSSMKLHDFVAVINLRSPPKVLKQKSPVLRHNQVQLNDVLWMVTHREWNYFLKWLKKVGRTPTRHGKEIQHTVPNQLNENELKLFVTKFDYNLSNEDKEKAEAIFLAHHNKEPYPQTPIFNFGNNKYESDDEEGEYSISTGPHREPDVTPQMANMTPQVSSNMMTPPTMPNLRQSAMIKDKGNEKKTKNMVEKVIVRGLHFASLHDDVDPFSLHSARIRKHYSEALFKEGNTGESDVSSPPSPQRSPEKSAPGNMNGRRVVFLSPGKMDDNGLQEQQQKLNPHFFGHPLDLKTPHHMRKQEFEEEEDSGNIDGTSSSVESILNQTTNEGIKIDLFPGAGSTAKPSKLFSKRYSIATSTPDALRVQFVPTITKAIPIAEDDIYNDDESYRSDPGDVEDRSVASMTDLEVSEVMKGRLALAETKAKEEAVAKEKAQSLLQTVLKEKDLHLEKLEDADRVRASLEGRLQETRTMLRILSSKGDDVKNLEKALSSIHVDALSVPAAQGSFPYPSSPSGGSSSNSSQRNTPLSTGGEDSILIRKVVKPKAHTRDAVSERRVQRRVNVAGQDKSSPLLSQKDLVKASEEVGGTDNTLLGLITDGNEEFRLAGAHAQSHGYEAAHDMNTEEQVAESTEDNLKEKFFHGTADVRANRAAFDEKTVRGHQLWDDNTVTELINAAPKNMEERLTPIDSRFLTEKEKLFLPFLRVHKGMGRKLFIDPTIVRGLQHTQWEICVWTIFQIYGRAGAGDSAIVRFITQLQVNRALKEAGISTDMVGKLELNLTKLRSGATKAQSTRTKSFESEKNPKEKSIRRKIGNVSTIDSKNQGGRVEFGFLFSEFLTAMTMLVTMIRDAKYKVGGRGDRLGATRGAAFDVISDKNLGPRKASSLLGEVRDDAWEIVRSQLEERFIKICAGERGSAQAIIDNKLEDTSRSLKCLSGVISEGSPYLASFPWSEVRAGKASDIVRSLAEIVKTPISRDYSECRNIWDRNAETMKTLYSFYASQLEPRPHLPRNIKVGAVSTGSQGMYEDLRTVLLNQYQDSAGTSRSGAELMVSFDNLRSLLTDFQIFPQHIDFQSLARIYRSVKVWEWAWCDTLGIKFNEKNKIFLNELDPLNLSVGSGNMCLTLCGLFEVLTRISHLGCDFSAKESNVGETLIYLLRLMNESHGRKILLSGKRRSVNLRPFLVS